MNKALTSPTQLSSVSSLSRGCMSAAETELFQDIESRIMIPIMCDATFATSPRSLTKIGPTFRTAGGNTSAARARLRGKTFVHFLKHSAMLNSLVRKLITEGRPASIKDRFRHAGLGETGCIYVANNNVVKLPNNSIGKFVMEIKPGIFNSGMDINYLLLFPGSLENTKLSFKFAEMPWIAHLFSCGESGKILQPKINSNAGFKFPRWGLLKLNDNIEKPIATPILRKVCSILDLAFRQRAAIENPESVSNKSKSIPFPLKVSSFERNPTKRLSASVAKVWAPMLLTGFCVLLAHCIYSAGMKAKLLTASRSQYIEIETSRPALAPLDCMLLRVISKIPDIVNRPCLLVKQASKRFYSVAINQDQFGKLGMRFLTMPFVINFSNMQQEATNEH